MSWGVSTLRCLHVCSRWTVSIKPTHHCKYVARGGASTVFRKEPHRAVNKNVLPWLPSVQYCSRSQVLYSRRHFADFSKPDLDRLDTRKYLLSRGINISKLGQDSFSVLQRDLEEVKSLLKVLEYHSFTREEMDKIIGKNSSILMLDEQDLHTRLSMFIEIGMKPQDVIKISDLVLFGDLDVVTANVHVMQDLLKASSKWICSLFKYKPQVFQETCDFTHDEIRSNIIMIREILLHFGCTDVEKVLRTIMRDDYRLFRVTQEQVKLIVEWLTNNGITGEDLVYVIKRSPNIFQFTPQQLSQRMSNLQTSLLLEESQLQQFVVRYPRALGMNYKNLNAHIDFFIEKHIHVHHLANNPFILWVSIKKMEKRYQEQKELGLLKKPENIPMALVRMVINTNRYDNEMDEIRRSREKKKMMKNNSKLG